MSAHPSVVPFQFFPTADGHIAIAAPKEKFFRTLVEAMDLPEVGARPAVRGLRVARSASRGPARHPHRALRRGDHGGLARATARAGPDRPRSIADAGAGSRRAARQGHAGGVSPPVVRAGALGRAAADDGRLRADLPTRTGPQRRPGRDPGRAGVRPAGDRGACASVGRSASSTTTRAADPSASLARARRRRDDRRQGGLGIGAGDAAPGTHRRRALADPDPASRRAARPAGPMRPSPVRWWWRLRARRLGCHLCPGRGLPPPWPGRLAVMSTARSRPDTRRQAGHPGGGIILGGSSWNDPGTCPSPRCGLPRLAVPLG